MLDERIRVLVVGDSTIVRAGLESAISESGRFEVVGATDLAGSAELLESTGASAILMESGILAPKLPPALLTPREIEVLRLLADGASNKVIAYKLGISEHTVKFHVTSILTKLNAGTRTEAVTLGVRMGLVYL